MKEEGNIVLQDILTLLILEQLKKIINIDSRFRNAYYNSKSSDFHLDLPETYKKVVKMNLIAYEIPLTIYGINNSNNHFYIKGL